VEVNEGSHKIIVYNTCSSPKTLKRFSTNFCAGKDSGDVVNHAEPFADYVVGVASRMIEAAVAPETAAAARTNPARGRPLTTAGRTGRVSYVSGNVRSM